MFCAVRFVIICCLVGAYFTYLFLYFFFFFKQKTAYEMRISDWSSDVCSSDLVWPSAPHGQTPSQTAFVMPPATPRPRNSARHRLDGRAATRPCRRPVRGSSPAAGRVRRRAAWSRSDRQSVV